MDALLNIHKPNGFQLPITKNLAWVVEKRIWSISLLVSHNKIEIQFNDINAKIVNL